MALHCVGFTVVFTGAAAGRPAGPAPPPGDVDPGVAPLRHGHRCAASALRYSPNTADRAARPVPWPAPRVRTGPNVGRCGLRPGVEDLAGNPAAVVVVETSYETLELADLGAPAARDLPSRRRGHSRRPQPPRRSPARRSALGHQLRRSAPTPCDLADLSSVRGGTLSHYEQSARVGRLRGFSCRGR